MRRGRTRTELVILVFLAAWLFAFVVVTLAQEERITLTTYYPAPFGVYRILRVVPSTLCTPFTACARAGEICYRQADNLLYVCGGIPNQWRVISNLWSISQVNTNNIYNTNTLVPGGGNVGVNTTNPMSTLDVRGSTNICVREQYTATSINVTCPPGFAITTVNTAVAAPQMGFIMCCRDCGTGAPDIGNDGVCP
ncbi:MAG: hypothetical protein ACM3L6_02860 [Deltaproteobacteria bacterium]